MCARIYKQNATCTFVYVCIRGSPIYVCTNAWWGICENFEELHCFNHIQWREAGSTYVKYYALYSPYVECFVQLRHAKAFHTMNFPPLSSFRSYGTRGLPCTRLFRFTVCACLSMQKDFIRYYPRLQTYLDVHNSPYNQAGSIADVISSVQPLRMSNTFPVARVFA